MTRINLRKTITTNFRTGPRISRGLITIAQEIIANSVNTAEKKQQANDEYYEAIKKIKVK